MHIQPAPLPVPALRQASGRPQMLAAVAAAVLLSMGLHLGLLLGQRAPALAIGSGDAAPGRSPAAPSVRVTLHTRSAHPAGAQAGGAPSASRAPTAAQPSRTAAADALEQALADPSRPLDIAPAAGPVSPSAGSLQAGNGPSAQAYLVSEQVDEPAAPMSDWLVPRDETTAGRVFDFSARIFVSREGAIDRIELLESDGIEARARAPVQPPALLQSVLQELRRTAMRPARLQGHAVASVRTIGFHIEVEREAF